MNTQLQKVVDGVRETLGLQHHQLNQYHFFREKDTFNHTAYIMNMEWIPTDTATSEEDSTPAGTALVDVNFHTQEVKRIAFISDINSADSSLYPSSSAKEYVIEWIEDLTGLTFGRQFLIVHEEEQAMSFGAAVDNIPVSPTGTIETEFNDNGALTMFSIDGDFPAEEQIEWEPFALTPDKYDPVAKACFQLVELPDHTQEKWVLMYGIDEAFITNDAKETIPFTENKSSLVRRDKVITWNEPLEGSFEKREIDLSPEVELKQVLAHEPHPDTMPLTASEVASCEHEVLRFLRLVYPHESGQRKLTGLYLQNGYIIAELIPDEDHTKITLSKLKLIIERKTLTAINVVDQEQLFEAFDHFTEASQSAISKEDAFEKLNDYIEVEPVYVYDPDRERYIMCGKLDCAYGVDAVTGEVVPLNTL